MNVTNRMIFITLPGLLLAGALLSACALLNTNEDAKALKVPGEVISGEGVDSSEAIVIPATMMSGFSTVKLREDGKASIEEYNMSHEPELKDAYKILVVGHTDTSGRASYNRVLSRKRAQCVADYLVTTGVDADKIRVVGRGSREPLASNETSEGRVRNRRVEILVITESRVLDRILFPGAALFEHDSADLTAEGRAFLEEKRAEARDLLNHATYVEIVGHTDTTGDENDNMALSKSRATTVRNYLVGQGLDAGKVFTAGKGGAVPIAGNDTEQGRAQNNRIKVLILDRVIQAP